MEARAPSYLFVTTDVTPGRLALAVAKLTKGRTCILADSASERIWLEAGYHTATNIAPETLGEMGFVLSGASSEPDLELSILLAAQTANIPTGMSVDIPGAHRRFDEKLSRSRRFPEQTVYFAADMECALEIRKDFRQAQIIVVGTDNARRITPGRKTRDAVANLRKKYRTIVVFAGQKSTEDLGIVARSLEEHMPDAVLVLGFHPDPKKQPDQKKLQKAVAVLKSQGRVSFPGEIPGGTDNIASLADYVVGGYSGVLVTAAYGNKKVVSVAVDEVLQNLKTDCPEVKAIPMVTAGIATEITAPCDLSDLIFPKDVRDKISPFRPERVLRGIEQFRK